MPIKPDLVLSTDNVDHDAVENDQRRAAQGVSAEELVAGPQERAVTRGGDWYFYMAVLASGEQGLHELVGPP